MNNNIKCSNCNKVFNYDGVWKELDNLNEFVFCNFCNTKHLVNNTKHIDEVVSSIKSKHIDEVVSSIKCRKCSTSLDENIDQSKRLVRCFKCGAMNSRTPSSKDKKSINNSSDKKEDNKKYPSENNLLDISGIRELYTDEDGHLATYEDWNYSDPDL